MTYTIFFLVALVLFIGSMFVEDAAPVFWALGAAIWIITFAFWSATW